MSIYDFELETLAYFEARAILAGNKKAGPSQSFLEKAKDLMKQVKEKGVPVTPEELGWSKDGL